MTGISFIIVTSGTNDNSVSQIIDSIEKQNMPKYEVLIVGGMTTTISRKNTIHIPFDETLQKKAWLTKKKNIGANRAQYDVLVVSHDYYEFDPTWYEEFEKFGTDWDICIQQSLASKAQGSVRANGWRAGPIPGYPEIPWAMTIPWDIDCFIPYMAIQGAFWVCKKHVMIDNPLDETLVQANDDIEWSSRVVPGWLGEKPDQNRYKIVSNSRCITRLNKWKEPYPGNPDFEAIERSLDPLWNFLREGKRRSGVYHYESSLGRVVLG